MFYICIDLEGAGTVVWYPARSHYSGNGSTSFCVYPFFICRALDKGASTTKLKSLVWLGYSYTNSTSKFCISTKRHCLALNLFQQLWIMKKTSALQLWNVDCLMPIHLRLLVSNTSDVVWTFPITFRKRTNQY